jgi:hypothetical protein
MTCFLFIFLQILKKRGGFFMPQQNEKKPKKTLEQCVKDGQLTQKQTRNIRNFLEKL